ncbi:MAG: DUF2070 family protein [Thermoplasmata archaeon]
MKYKSVESISHAQKNIEKTANIARYMFSAPNPLWMIAPIFLVSILFGLVLGYSQNELRNGSTIDLTSSMIYSTILLALPAFISGIITTPLAKALDGIFYSRRSMLLAFISLTVIGAVILVGKVLQYFIYLETYYIIIFGYAMIIWLRHMVMVTVSNASNLRSLLASSNQSVLGFLAILYLYPLGKPDVLVSVILFSIFLFSTILFMKAVTSPFRRNFENSGLDIVNHTLANFTEPTGNEGKGLEKFFHSFSETIDANVGIVAFKAEGEIKSLVIVPSVHPGPFGHIGGSNLPTKIASGLSELTEHVLLFHGSATHDQNPATSEECNKIIEEVKRSVGELQYSNHASKFVRCRNTFDVCAQSFNDFALLVHTSSPLPTDDIDYPTGYAAALTAKNKGATDAAFIDAHNCIEPGSGSIFFGSKDSFEVLSLVEKCVGECKKKTFEKIRAGVAQDKTLTLKEGVAKQGIQALVVEVNNQKTAYILFDGNNMVPSLRERLLESIKDIVDEAEVFTSDNHVIHVTLGAHHPVGFNTDLDRIVKITRSTVLNAVDNLEEVEVGAKSTIVHDLRVFGFENTTRLSAVINSTTSILRSSAAYSLLTSILLSILTIIVFRTI